MSMTGRFAPEAALRVSRSNFRFTLESRLNPEIRQVRKAPTADVPSHTSGQLLAQLQTHAQVRLPEIEETG
jgi:hypothetical protein